MAVSILLEGPEGAGKSTITSITYKLLEDSTNHPLLFIHEPGGTPIGEAIRGLLLGDEYKDHMSPTAQMLLFTAARAQLFEEKIYPFKAEHPDGIILSDRSYPSTFALQTVDGVSASYIEHVQAPFMEDYPTKLFYIDLPPEESKLRVRAAAQTTADRNWRDQVSLETFQAIRSQYHRIAQEMRPDTIVLDGFKRPWDLVERVYTETLEAFGEMKDPQLDVKEWVMDFMNEHDLLNENLIETQERHRMDLGYPSKIELHQRMHDEWKSLGWGEHQVIGKERRG